MLTVPSASLSTLSDLVSAVSVVFIFPLHLDVSLPSTLEDFCCLSEAFLRTSGHFPLFWSHNQCLIQQSTASDFICDGSSNLRSVSGRDCFKRKSEGLSAMSVHRIRPPNQWKPGQCMLDTNVYNFYLHTYTWKQPCIALKLLCNDASAVLGHWWVAEDSALHHILVVLDCPPPQPNLCTHCS